mmetsp:Transcript_13845/g.27333  ORF Transcript_13845/g.27333 Transcript_13845/m.27333 type:complete len:533 (-) Transcript_13845:1145-2743(-)
MSGVPDKPKESKTRVSKLRAAACEFVSEKEADRLPEFLAPVYGPEGCRSALQAAELLVHACDRFLADFGEQPVKVVRCPARVNLRGMHIDNNGGYTNTICVDKEVFLVFATVPMEAGNPLLQLHNVDDVYSPVVAHPNFSEEQVKASESWVKYVTGTVCAMEEFARIKSWPLAIRGVIISDCPVGAGLSSSHALILCILNALLDASGIEGGLDPISELQIAQRAEHLAGVKSGLTDQGAMIFGNCAKLQHARFYDLKMQEIPSTVQFCSWPSSCSVVVANSRVVRQLAKGSNAVAYALPRLGCAIALPVMRSEAHVQGLLGDDEASWGLQGTLRLLKLVPAAATLDELLRIFPQHSDHIHASVQRFIPGGRQALDGVAIPLRGSTLFTLAESARAREFLVAMESGDLGLCGKLMDIGHEGDDLDGNLHISDENLDDFAKTFAGLSHIPGAFQAGHARLDELCAALRASGAKGASLTGAGRGGCVVGLFDSAHAATAASRRVLEHFTDLKEHDVFVARPIKGRGMLDLSSISD